MPTKMRGSSQIIDARVSCEPCSRIQNIIMAFHPITSSFEGTPFTKTWKSISHVLEISTKGIYPLYTA